MHDRLQMQQPSDDYDWSALRITAGLLVERHPAVVALANKAWARRRGHAECR